MRGSLTAQPSIVPDVSENPSRPHFPSVANPVTTTSGSGESGVLTTQPSATAATEPGSEERDADGKTAKETSAPQDKPVEAPSPGVAPGTLGKGAAKGESAGEPIRAILARLEQPRWLYGTVTVLVFVLWCAYYQRWPGQADFGVPVGYLSGDPVAVLGTSKTFGDFPAPWNVTAPRLNAPFGADWNDYPHSEKFPLYVSGLLHRFFSVGTAANLSLIVAHLSAACAFLWTARRLATPVLTALAGALLFAFSPFMMGRALGHLFIAYVWHLPLLLYVVKRLDVLAAAPGRKAWVFGLILMALTSFQHPYYAVIGLQLVLLATLAGWLRRDRRTMRYGAALLASGIGAFAFNQLNIVLYRGKFGPNEAMSGRSLNEFLVWGLKVPDLFLPVSHPLTFWAEFAKRHYFEAGNGITENYFAFLGLPGVLLFVLLLGSAVVAGFKGRAQALPVEIWVVGYVLLFALAGGFNYLLASFGFTWLRSANRFSILILCALYLWGGQAVPAISRPALRRSIPAVAALIGLWELFGMRPDDFPERTKLIAKVMASDGDFGRDLERRLPQGAAVFQLPVMDFPESAHVQAMEDYEPMRPYLFTRDLRFSYGAHRGRDRELWQRHVERSTPRDMVSYLEQHGFDAILINRRGFADRGHGLETAFKALDLKPVVTSDIGDMVAYSLTKRASTLPVSYKSVTLDEGFMGWETDDKNRWSWASGSASLAMFVTPGDSHTYRISFILESLLDRNVFVEIHGKRVASFPLGPGKFVDASFEWRPNQPLTRISLVTDVPGQRPPNGDPRTLAFRVINPEAVEVQAPERRRNR